jgi:hypothetical protein
MHCGDSCQTWVSEATKLDNSRNAIRSKNQNEMAADLKRSLFSKRFKTIEEIEQRVLCLKINCGESSDALSISAHCFESEKCCQLIAFQV